MVTDSALVTLSPFFSTSTDDIRPETSLDSTVEDSFFSDTPFLIVSMDDESFLSLSVSVLLPVSMTFVSLPSLSLTTVVFLESV